MNNPVEGHFDVVERGRNCCSNVPKDTREDGSKCKNGGIAWR